MMRRTGARKRARLSGIAVRTCVGLGGAAFTFGIVGIALPLLGWWSGGGYYNAQPFYVLALLAVLLGLILWRALANRVLRSVTRAATIGSVALLVSCGLNAGYIDTKVAARIAGMKFDLRELVQAQEEFCADSGRFSPTLPPNYTPSRPDASPEVRLTPDGFTATIFETEYSVRCAVFVGGMPLAPATEAGVVACTRLPFVWREYIFGVALLCAGVVFTGLALAAERMAQGKTI